MAEVVITTTSTDKTRIRRGSDTQAERTRVVRQTIVRSIAVGSLMDVSVLRDLMKALDEVGVSDRATVEGRRSDSGHLVQLIVQHYEDITPDESEPEADTRTRYSFPMEVFVGVDAPAQIDGEPSGHPVTPEEAK